MPPFDEVDGEEIQRRLAALKDDEGYFIDTDPADQQRLRLWSVGPKFMEKLRESPGLLHCTGQMLRAGVSGFSAQLEHDCFMPGTPDNDYFLLTYYHWCGMLYCVVSVPEDAEFAARTAAAAFKLRMVPQPTWAVMLPGGSPIIFVARQEKAEKTRDDISASIATPCQLLQFPLGGAKSLYSLEFRPEDHPEGYVELTSKQWDKETSQIEDLQARTRRRLDALDAFRQIYRRE